MTSPFISLWRREPGSGLPEGGDGGGGRGRATGGIPLMSALANALLPHDRMYSLCHVRQYRGKHTIQACKEKRQGETILPGSFFIEAIYFMPSFVRSAPSLSRIQVAPSNIQSIQSPGVSSKGYFFS